MARYWQAKTLHGFYVEGTLQDRSIAEKLLESFEGVKMSEEILGAGFYLWLTKGADPALRVKDLSDRTVIEVLLPDTPVKKKPSPAVEDEEGEDETSAPAAEEEVVPSAPAIEEPPQEETGEAEDAGTVPPPHPESALAHLLAELDTVLGQMYERVAECPSEFQAQIDLKLHKWQTPQPMAITRGEPIGGLEDIDLEATVGRGGGGLAGMLIIAVVVAALGVGTWAILNTAASEPYYVFQPGTQFERTEEAVGFIQSGTNELIIIQVPTRLDTTWGNSPLFVRADEDTVSTNVFVAEEVDEMRVENEPYGEVVILSPAEEADESTANMLDVSSLTWNQSEEWEEWFAMEINRALIRGTLVRLDNELYLQAGQNYVGLEMSPYLSEAEQIMLMFAESREIEVTLEVQFDETYRYNQERTSARRRLFRAVVGRVMLP